MTSPKGCVTNDVRCKVWPKLLNVNIFEKQGKIMGKWVGCLRDRHQVSVLILTEFKRINKLQFPSEITCLTLEAKFGDDA